MGLSLSLRAPTSSQSQGTTTGTILDNQDGGENTGARKGRTGASKKPSAELKSKKSVKRTTIGTNMTNQRESRHLSFDRSTEATSPSSRYHHGRRSWRATRIFLAASSVLGHTR
ncbi:unnamed protein product [Ectocarpus fasciculatus]